MALVVFAVIVCLVLAVALPWALLRTIDREGGDVSPPAPKPKDPLENDVSKTPTSDP